MPASGLIVAAPRSGAGKTTIALALVAALRRRGLAVRAAKTGPDYIDPAFHAAASGWPCVNLDSWAMPPALLDSVLTDAARGAEFVVTEAAMGLFDGADAPPGRTGSAADIAARFNLPVLLVLDVSGQAQSAAAIVRGFASHAPAVAISGVILNKVASERHRAMIMPAIAALGMPVAGSIPRDAALSLPERHLGLVQAQEHGDLHARIAQLADLAERCIDLDRIVQLAKPVRTDAHAVIPLPPPGQRIALAQDAAFSFIYPHLIEGWRRAGAEIVTFSPLADQPPPADCDACWLPGGYPELHAGTLAQAEHFRAGLARFAAQRPVHGECGGYMVLGEILEDAASARHRMAGLLSHSTSFARRRLSLGYRAATLLDNGILGRKSVTLRGHEFHYATLIDPGADEPLASMTDAAGRALGQAGARRGLVSGSFFHILATEMEPA